MLAGMTIFAVCTSAMFIMVLSQRYEGSPLPIWTCLSQVSCSSGGLCIGSKALALATTAPPVMTLRTNSYLLSLVTVKQGKSYAACASGQQPTSGSIHTP